VCWYSKGLIHVNFLPHGITINEQYYKNLLWNDVHQEILKKRPGKLLMMITLLHDNVCPHTATFAAKWAGKS
jgi:hypothetical protein